MCCEGEKAKFEKREAERLKSEAAKDPRVKLRELEDPMTRALVAQMSGEDGLRILDKKIEEAKTECDAEYARQFPNGPQPIFTANRSNGADMHLLKSALRGATQEDIVSRIEQAGLIQSARQVFMPNEDDKTEHMKGASPDAQN